MQSYNKSTYKIPANPLFPARRLIYMPECHSTNVIMEQMVKQNSLPEGSVVIAGYQSAGKGQRGNTWVAERDKNLTFSLFVAPSFLRASSQMFLTKAFSLAITDWLKKITSVPAHIKWPNDILLNQKKVCGMLIENQIHADRLAISIAGIGININQLNFPFSSATSLLAETGRTWNLYECLYDLIHHLDYRYGMLREEKLEALRSDYLGRLYGLGSELTFGKGDQSFPGTILGVDEHGRLEVRTPWGIRLYAFKEIAIQWPLK
jgi:BirA family biotin operon repressor/biotin-[acetyl-CoA-carboxylase] ligase